MNELWTTEQCRAFLGAASIRSASRILLRLGVEAVDRQPGRSGMNRYPADEVRDRVAQRPGRGRPAGTEPRHRNATYTTGDNTN